MHTTLATDDELERKRLLWRLRVNMLLLLARYSEIEVSAWIRLWLQTWRPPE